MKAKSGACGLTGLINKQSEEVPSHILQGLHGHNKIIRIAIIILPILIMMIDSLLAKALSPNPSATVSVGVATT